MWRSFFVWVATNPEEAASLGATLITLLTALAVALEKRAPKAAAVIRSLVPFIVGVIRALRRPDASTGPAHKVVQPVITPAASRVVDADGASAIEQAPTKEAPKVPPVVFLLALGAGCAGAAQRDAAEAAIRLTVERCTQEYQAAATPADLARLDIVCVPAADALDALEASR